MNKKLFLLFWVCLAVVLVKSESTIEVDENGDEYDVKRFNIQGRQLNGGRSQCVETRRKRSTPSVVKPLESAEKSIEDEDNDGMKNDAMLFYAPPVLNYGANDDDDEDDEDDVNVNMNANMMQFNDLNENNQNNEDLDDENDEEDEESVFANGADTIEVVQLPQLPVLGQLQSQGQSVAAIASTSSVNSNRLGGFANAVSVNKGGQGNAGHVSVSQFSNGGFGNAGHVSFSANSEGSNGIMVVQSHVPPKVNPQTHAVFELVPVKPGANNNYKDDDDSDGPEDIDFKEELSPVSTTAIWSTGVDDNLSDNLDNLYGDLDNKPLKPVKVFKKKPNFKPVNFKKTTKRPLRPIRKNKRKNNKNKKNKKNKNKNAIANKKRRVNNKRRRNKNGIRRLNKRKNNKIRLGNKRRRPVRLGPVSENFHNRDSNNDAIKTVTKKKNRHTNANKKDIAKKRKDKNNLYNIDQGDNTYTRTVTMTETGDSNDEPSVNCIIIRKDDPLPPPTPSTTTSTTARPFWNLLGRSANGTPVANGPYGRRKRINYRFIA